ncbi:MAG TPA: NADH-quinone oxidoreductase subunit J [Dehalococcoidia bacterium]
MSGQELAFYGASVLAVLGALGVVASRNIVHAAVLLIASLVGVAAVLLLISVEFLALAQLLIYGGAVAILLLFALMLTRVREVPLAEDGPQKPLAVLAGLVLLGVLFAVIFGTQWPGVSDELTVVSFTAIGERLFRDYLVPFEIAALLLVVALVGAVVIGGLQEDEG